MKKTSFSNKCNQRKIIYLGKDPTFLCGWGVFVDSMETAVCHNTFFFIVAFLLFKEPSQKQIP